MTMYISPRNQGQIVDVAYGWIEGVLYRRTHDRSDRTTVWHRARPEASAGVREDVWNDAPELDESLAWVACSEPSE